MPNDYTGLLSGSYWTGIEVAAKPVIVTYSFPTTAPGSNAALTDWTPTALASFQAFTTTEQQMARDALAEWGTNSGLIFVEVAAGQGDINFQKLDFSGTAYDGAGGVAYRPFGDWNSFTYPYFSSDLDSAGDVFMNTDFALSYATLLHEIGHAIGLKHPTEAWTQWAANPAVTHNVWSTDDPALTIMSQLSGGTGHLTAIDIQAVQAIYGTNAQDGTQVASWTFSASKQILTQTGFATADAIRGSSVKDVINGMEGDDRLFGLNGNDTLNGGAGNDTLDGGPGSDKLTGGAGDDTYLAGAGDKITELADGGYDTVYSAVSYSLAANTEVLALLGTAKLSGTGNADGNSLFAGGGIAVLRGMAGDDYIVGGAAKDLLTGGAGADLIYGQAQADQFIFATYADFATTPQIDTIGDFSHAEGDKISLKSIDPDAVTAGNQAFSFVGTAAFTTDARFQVRYVVQGSDTVIQIDSDHNGTADYQILLYNVTALVASDFLL